MYFIPIIISVTIDTTLPIVVAIVKIFPPILSISPVSILLVFPFKSFTEKALTEKLIIFFLQCSFLFSLKFYKFLQF